MNTFIVRTTTFVLLASHNRFAQTRSHCTTPSNATKLTSYLEVNLQLFNPSSFVSTAFFLHIYFPSTVNYNHGVSFVTLVYATKIKRDKIGGGRNAHGAKVSNRFYSDSIIGIETEYGAELFK